MILYSYQCKECYIEFEEYHSMAHRDVPLTKPCPACNKFAVIRMMGNGGFIVPEGGCGNAANGYSSYHGDAELFKAKGTAREAKLKKDYGLK